MASHDEHVTQAVHNETIARYLLDPVCKSVAWVTIITFYAALQYVEAAFANTSIGHVDGIKIEGKSPHKTREDLIALDTRLKEIYLDYRELRNASETFRYLKAGHDYLNEEDAKMFIDKNLYSIKKHLLDVKLIKTA